MMDAFSGLSWMAWTWPTAAFFLFILLCFIIMSVWEYYSPGGGPRHGILGLDTTRGDRLFISLLSTAYIMLAWLGFFGATALCSAGDRNPHRDRDFPLGVSCHALPCSRHRSGHDFVAGHRLRRRLHGCASAQQEFPPAFPDARLGRARPGGHLGQACSRPAARPCGKAGISAAAIAAIGITNQRETTLIWDRDDRQADPPRHRLAGPPHRRALPALHTAGHEPGIAAQDRPAARPLFLRHQAGLASSTMSPGARERAERGELCFGTVDSFLLWRLTGGKVHATDATNASRTLLFDIHSGSLRRRAARTLRACRAPCCRRSRTAPRCRHDRARAVRRRRSRSAASPATSRPRPSARPASSPA